MNFVQIFPAMELVRSITHITPAVEEFLETMQELNLTRSASEAAAEMEFGSMQEMEEAVKRAFTLCLAASIPLKGNFKRIYKSTVAGICFDWQLSELAYRLVCMNGDPSNPLTASYIIQLIKEHHTLKENEKWINRL